MNKNEKTILIIIAIVMVFICGFVAARMFGGMNHQANIEPPSAQQEDEIFDKTEDISQKVYANVFFIGQNAGKEEVYRAVKREYDPDIDGSKIKFAITALVNGPKAAETARGVYSEIPYATQIISIKEEPNKVIIDLSSDFAAGGGTDSLYKRIYQVIKTANNNTDKPVYLYIKKKKADVIGGEGIMLTQPLKDSSLDG